MTTNKIEVELKNFFIFNSSWDSKEGEEYKKVLYYYPPTDEINTQVNNVGLVEAIIKFTGNFKPNAPVNSLHTQKKRQLYYQPEENYWMVMTLNLPHVAKSRNGSTVNEYLEEDVHDTVYEAVLKQAYLMYRLFAGTFCSTEKKSDVSHLRNKLEHFFSAYLKTLKLTHCDILNVFAGIHFLPLDKQNFLNVQCFINSLECNYPMIRYVSFLFNDSLIWSGIEPNDMQIIYQYLIGTLLPAHMETELQGGSIPRNPLSPFASLHYGRFITGPSNLKTAGSVGKIPKIFLNNETNPSVFYFIVYRALSSTVCLFIDGETDLSLHLFKELDEFMGPKLSSIASDIAEYCTKHITSTNTPDGAPRFIYFNKLNLAYKSTVHLDNRQTGNVACNKESIKVMADMNAKRALMGHAGETIVKTMNDYWIVGKISNLREFYIAIQQKNASLIDISDEVKKICDTELKGIFFHPM
ncbi:hypothetical protein ILUMI_22533 [Ignelater luminosus]|uniref:Vacuolar fusion protein CCZ1 homolog n=1 Tax=Ignelater luminosus TaxID=2038154 RepID=A0A8K0CEB9_IGNLU|nr:hypothetical protein ILUMI_22533 [Ignelater luminosus]